MWVCEKPLIISNTIFRYKYVLNTEASKGISGQWEAGIDRLVDLRLLPTITRPMQYVLSTKAGEGGQYLPVKNASEIYEPNAKHVELEDEWETFLLKFSVMNPLENPHDELYLSSEILGDKLVKLEKVKVP